MNVVKSQAETVDHLLSTVITKPVVELAVWLAHILPLPLEKTLLLNTGSESVEAADKVAKTYTGKFEVISVSLEAKSRGVIDYKIGRAHV